MTEHLSQIYNTNPRIALHNSRKIGEEKLSPAVGCSLEEYLLEISTPRRMPVHSHDRIAADLAHRRHHADRHVLLVNQIDQPDPYYCCAILLRISVGDNVAFGRFDRRMAAAVDRLAENCETASVVGKLAKPIRLPVGTKVANQVLAVGMPIRMATLMPPQWDTGRQMDVAAVGFQRECHGIASAPAIREQAAKDLHDPSPLAVELGVPKVVGATGFRWRFGNTLGQIGETYQQRCCVRFQIGLP